MEEKVIPILRVQDADIADAWYKRLGFQQTSEHRFEPGFPAFVTIERGPIQKLLPLSVDEFLCRFLLHILPKGFVRIRNFGFLANRKRATLLPLCFQLLGSARPPQAEPHASSTEDSPDLWRCPKFGGPMKVIERLTAAEIQLRSPPVVTAAA